MRSLYCMLITLLQPLVVVETTSSEVPTMTGNYTADIESSNSTIIAATLLNAAPMSNTNALIPGWYALASTNFCWRVADLHITRSPRGGRAAQPPCGFLAAIPDSKRVIKKRRRVNATSNVGIVWLLPEGPTVIQEGINEHYKYCRDESKEEQPMAPVQDMAASVAGHKSEGILVMLVEAHGNQNINHGLRDTLFLAHLLQEIGTSSYRFHIDTVLVDDIIHSKHKSVISYRRDSIRALLTPPPDKTASALLPPPRVVFTDHLKESFRMKDSKNNASSNEEEGLYDELVGKKSLCSKIAVQKLGSWSSNDYRDADFYRSQGWRHCGVDPSIEPDLILIEQHGGSTRQWEAKTIDLLVRSLQRSSISSERTVRVVQLTNMTFCDQVQLFARSFVVVAHHGAAPAGNGVFMHDRSLLIEINSICDQGSMMKEVFADAGNGDFAVSAGKKYIGARVAHAYNRHKENKGNHECVDYMYTDVSLGIDAKRWAKVIQVAEGLLIWGSPPPVIFSL